jgi:hypothetical protein
LSTCPTFTPAIRMSSPLLSPTASVKTARYFVVALKVMLPIVTASSAVAIVVTTTKIDNRTMSSEVFLSRSLVT